MLHRRARVATTAFLSAFVVLTAVASTSYAQELFNALDRSCSGKVAKGARKVAKTYAKETAKCRDADISGKAPAASCPDSTAQLKIQKAVDGGAATAAKGCGSTCSVSLDVSCLADNLCPPQATAGPEPCKGDGFTKPFDMRNFGFPGPFCETALGHPVSVASDLGECAAVVALGPAQAVIDVVYGSIDDTSGISPAAAKCLASISKAAQKLSDTVFNGVIKCRSAIQKGEQLNPAGCTTDDPKLAAKIAKGEAKLASSIDSKCTDSDIAELDLCLNGVNATLDKTAAIDCLIPALEEIADTTLQGAARQFSAVTLVESAYPPTVGVCGDGVVNQIPNPFALIGEECDGGDDDACPGECFPPGDVFECTCPSNRLRFLADGFSADLDSGWTGTSHNSGVTDGAGFIVNMENCDCDAFTGATCTGSTGDSVCDVTSTYQLPQCSWDAGSGVSCEAHGTDADFQNDNDDCYICDQYSANAGAFCREEAIPSADDCQSQCFDANGSVVGLCVTQADCNAGEVCRGLCDNTQKCIITTNGAPLPISAGATPVCVITTFREDIFGTANIVTGEHEMYLQQFSAINLGASVLAPCPVCGGFCQTPDINSILFGRPCEGTCSLTTSQKCRFSEDCPSGETCTTASDECGDGFCNLSLVCGGGSIDAFGGPNAGKPCRIEAYTDKFGTVSGDCPPLGGGKFVGKLQIDFYPQTSEAVSLPDVLACSNGSFSNYSCPCPQAGGTEQTRPNKCAFSCNAPGPQFGQGCGTGAGNIGGLATTCSNSSAACDEDADCPGGTCTDNPLHCEGDPSTALKACTTNGDCGAGTCVDACSGGQCVPLCLPSDDPLFPPGAGKFPDDPEEGFCAGNRTSHCDGVNEDFIPCPPEVVGQGCSATCSISATACLADADCPTGETCSGSCLEAKNCSAGLDAVIGTDDDIPGTGKCVSAVQHCFVNEAAAEGGDTLNGKGDPTNVRTVSTYCIPGTGNAAVDATSGLGGPGRLRQTGVNVPAYTTLP